ncbi:DUF6970 domain-containing protein [Hymenobacter terrestris]|uniref:DUF6970 domain-containing protein n=1 Tax=Hymenobacter terrestris TaxID=2748310 RepID=A0ABX2PYT0_9BACT|nr:hypothetical protein [Hymenobacter terrestris]NVO83839.1 hypothetical protein [Hymenobacter terrestris]
MKRTMLLLALSALGFGSCKDTMEGVEPSSGCITEKVQQFAKGSSCKTGPRTIGASIKEFRFQDRLVIVFSPGNCGADEASDVLDENCRSIGFLGGFSGNTTINGESFSKAEFKRTLWEQ